MNEIYINKEGLKIKIRDSLCGYVLVEYLNKVSPSGPESGTVIEYFYSNIESDLKTNYKLYKQYINTPEDE